MNGQRFPSRSDVTEFRVFLETLFAGPWVVDKKRRGQA
jgi:hypothetical protein